MSLPRSDSTPTSWHNPAMVGGIDTPLSYDVEVEAVLIFPNSTIEPSLEAPQHSDKKQYEELGGVYQQTRPIRKRWSARLTQKQKTQLQALPTIANDIQYKQYLRRWPHYHGGAFVTDLTPDTYSESANRILRPIQDRIVLIDDLPWVQKAITAHGSHPLHVVADVLASSSLVFWVAQHYERGVDLQVWLNHKTGERPTYDDYQDPENKHKYTMIFNDTLQSLPPVEVLRWAQDKTSLAKVQETLETTRLSQQSKSAQKLGFVEPTPSSFVNFTSHGFEMASPIFDVDNLRSAQELAMHVKALKGNDRTYYNAIVNESCGLHVHIRSGKPDTLPKASSEASRFAGMSKKAIATLILFLTLYEEQLDTLFPAIRRVTPLENRLQSTGLWSIRDWAVMERAGDRHATDLPNDELSLDSGDMAAAIRYFEKNDENDENDESDESDESDKTFRLRYKPLQSIIADIYSWNRDQLATMPTRRLDGKKKFAASVPKHKGSGKEQQKLYKWGPKEASKDHPLTFWYDDNKQSFEFRQHEGCLDGHHVHHWVQLCAAIVRTATKAANLIEVDDNIEMTIPIKVDEKTGIVTEDLDDPSAEEVKKKRKDILHRLGHHWNDWHDGMSIYDLFDACGLDHTNEVRQHFESRAAYYATPPYDETDEFEPLAYEDKGRINAMPKPKFRDSPMATWTERPPTWYNVKPPYKPTSGESAQPPLRGEGSPGTHDLFTQLQSSEPPQESEATPTDPMDVSSPSPRTEDEGPSPPPWSDVDMDDVSSMQDRSNEDRPGHVSAAERERDGRIRKQDADSRRSHNPRRFPKGRHAAGSKVGASTSLSAPSQHNPDRSTNTLTVTGTLDSPEHQKPAQTSIQPSLQDPPGQIGWWGESAKQRSRVAQHYSTTRYQELKSRAEKLLEDSKREEQEILSSLQPAQSQSSGSNATRNRPESAARPSRVIVRDGGHGSGESGVIFIPGTVSEGDGNAVAPTQSPFERSHAEEAYPPDGLRDSKGSDESFDSLFDKPRDEFSAQGPDSPDRDSTFSSNLPGNPIILPDLGPSCHPWDKSASAPAPISSSNPSKLFSLADSIATSPPSLEPFHPQTQTTNPTSPDYITTPRGTRRARFAVPEVGPTDRVPIRTRSGSRVVRWVLPQVAPGVPVHFVPPEAFDSIVNALTHPRTEGGRKFVTRTGAERTAVWGRQRGQFNSEGGGGGAALVDRDDLNDLRREWERRRREAENEPLFCVGDEDEGNSSDGDSQDGHHGRSEAEDSHNETETSLFHLPTPTTKTGSQGAFTMPQGNPQPRTPFQSLTEYGLPILDPGSNTQQAPLARQQLRAGSSTAQNSQRVKPNWLSPHVVAPSENIIPRDHGPLIIRGVVADEIGLNVRLRLQRFLGELEDKGMDVHEAGLRESNRVYDELEAKRKSKSDLVMTSGGMEYVLEDEQPTDQARESAANVMNDVDEFVRDAVEGSFSLPGLSVNDAYRDDNLQTPLSGNKITDAEADDEDSDLGPNGHEFRWTVANPAGSVRWPSEMHGEYDGADLSGSSSSSSGPTSSSGSSSSSSEIGYSRPRTRNNSTKTTLASPYRSGEQRHVPQDRVRVFKDRRPPKSKTTTRSRPDSRVGQLGNTLTKVPKYLSTVTKNAEQSDVDTQTDSSEDRHLSAAELRTNEEARRRAVNKLKRAQRAIEQASAPRRVLLSPPRRLPNGFSPNNPSRLRVSVRSGDIDDNQPLRTLESAGPWTPLKNYAGTRVKQKRSDTLLTIAASGASGGSISSTPAAAPDTGFENMLINLAPSALRPRRDDEQDVDVLGSAGDPATRVNQDQGPPQPRRSRSLADLLRRMGNGISTAFGSVLPTATHGEFPEDRSAADTCPEEDQDQDQGREQQQQQQQQRERSISYSPPDATSNSSDSDEDKNESNPRYGYGFREEGSDVNPGYGMWLDGSTDVSDDESSTFSDGLGEEGGLVGDDVNDRWRESSGIHGFVDRYYRSGAPTPESEGDRRGSIGIPKTETEAAAEREVVRRTVAPDSDEDEVMKKWLSFSERYK